MILFSLLQVELLKSERIDYQDSSSDLYPYNCSIVKCFFEDTTKTAIVIGSVYADLIIKLCVFENCRGTEGGCISSYSNSSVMSRLCSFISTGENSPTFGELSNNALAKFKLILITGSYQKSHEPPNGICFAHSEKVVMKQMNLTDNLNIATTNIHHNGFNRFKFLYLIVFGDKVLLDEETETSIILWDAYRHQDVTGFMKYSAFLNNSASSIVVAMTYIVDDSLITDCTFIQNTVRYVFSFYSECTLRILNCVFDGSPLFEEDRYRCFRKANRTLTSFVQDKGVTCFYDTEVVGLREETVCDFTVVSYPPPPSFAPPDPHQDVFYTPEPPKKSVGFAILLGFSVLILSLVISLILYSLRSEDPKLNRPLPRALGKKVAV